MEFLIKISWKNFTLALPKTLTCNVLLCFDPSKWMLLQHFLKEYPFVFAL